MTHAQPDLFGEAGELPEGMSYRPELLGHKEEAAIADRLASLPLKPFQFHGFEGNRRTISYGYHYAFDGSGLRESEAMPDWVLPVRARAAAFAGLAPEALVHLLAIEYAPGAGIGWHRDRPVFGDVIGISLLAPARLRFRRKQEDGKWERKAVWVEPRSAYLLSGPSRNQWEHSLAPMAVLRYSLTFRTLISSTELPSAED